jgi:cell wall-associated NlpC family hydrolase
MTSPWSTDLTQTDVVTRARHATTLHGIRYRLGAGGRDPADESPADDYGECDCSGFVAWCLGIPRKLRQAEYVAFNGGWLSTDGMVHDILGPRVVLAPVTWADALPGDVLVYGNGGRVGHCGILANSGTDRAGRATPVSVIDCAVRGIRERDFRSFTARALSPVYVARYTGWKP